jgi:iron complex outermembrane recepter protein
MAQRTYLTLSGFIIPWIAVGTMGFAQSASPPPVSKEVATVLSAFHVASTQDKGYVATSSTPFKTKQNLADIPQAITVVTRDMIDDIGGYNASDILIYAGASPNSRGEAFSLRGSSSSMNFPLIDGQLDRTPAMDNLFVDSYEIMRGPAALLYPNTALSGVINRTTRKPLPAALNSVRVSYKDYGLYRSEIDSTGPIARVGEGKFSYRVLAAFQDGDAYWRNAEEKRIAFHPSLQLDYKNTRVLVAYDFNDLREPSGPTGVLTPDGKVFTGAGRNEINLPPGAMERRRHYGLRVQVVHQFAPNWGVRIGGDLNLVRRLGSVVLPTGVNYNDRTIGFFNRRNDFKLDDRSLSVDFNGNYKLFGVGQQSTFGLVLTNQKTIARAFVNSDFFNGITAQRIIRPLDRPNVDTLPVKPENQFILPANHGTRVRADLGNFYFQQVVDAIPDRLSLVAGVSRYRNETSNSPTIVSPTAVPEIAKSFETLHRFGVVFKVTRDVSLYAMEANTSLPPTIVKLVDGSVAAPASGKGKEVGIKFDYMNGRIVSTVAFFDLRTTGLTVFGGVLPTGENYVNPVGRVSQKGFDADIALRLTNAWQIVGTMYKGKVKDQNGAAVDASYKQSWSVFTRYDFGSSGNAKGLSIGGGASRISGRVVTSTTIIFPVGMTRPAFIDVEPGTLVTGFTNYTLNNHWSFRFQVNNILDRTYAVGITAAHLVDPSLPRSFIFSTKYRF